MAIESVGSTFQNGMNSSFPQAEGIADQGMFMGNAVSQVETPESLLADAAEELTFSADTTDDFELEERHERDKTQKAQDERVRLYQELMHQAGKGQALNQLRDSLHTRADARRAIDKAREFFPDPSDAWAALKELEDELRNSGIDADLLQNVSDAVVELEQTEGAAVLSGIQGALTAAGFDDLGSIDEMRNLYRNTVCEFSSVSEVFAHIQEAYGGDFERCMDFLFAALSADISSDTPSMGIRHLESVHSNLEEVRLTQSAYRLCQNMMQRWQDVHNVKNAALTPMELLGEVVKLCGMRFLGAAQITPLVQRAKAPDIEREVLFLQELLSTTRNFPIAMFDGEQGRMKVMDAVQEAVDQAVQREDEYLAQQEG